MTSVPNPFSARGDARYVGQTLVRQGLAIEVPYTDRRRGDVICYEYGTYGHIALQLSGGRVFEQNVNLGGVASKIVDGERVYASRIGSENEVWRVGKNAHVYRIKSYNEQGETTVDWKRQVSRLSYAAYLNRGLSNAEYTSRDGYETPDAIMKEIASSGEAFSVWKSLAAKFQVPVTDQWIKDRQADYNNAFPMMTLFSMSTLPQKFEVLTEELKKTKEENAALKLKITQLEFELDEYKNGDNIIITKKGWLGLYDVIRQFFAKLNQGDK